MSEKSLMSRVFKYSDLINDKGYMLEAPAAIIMPANEPHSVHAEEKFKMVLIMIKAG